MSDEVPARDQARSEPSPVSRTQAETRKLTDPLELRALAHPARIRLLSAVGLRGTLTATEAVEFVGGSPASCAYHLRILAKYGFIEDADGEDGRERPWRLTHTGYSWNDDAEDTQQRTVARALTDVVYGEWLDNIRRYQASSDRFPPEVRKVCVASEIVLFATPEEVAQVQREIQAIFAPFIDRGADISLRPPGHLPLEMIVFTHPAAPPASSPKHA